MSSTESSVYFIHSPSIPMTLKDPRDNFTIYGGGNQLVPGHEAILEMHANSESSALFYVVVVLVLYVLALMVVLTKYLRTERYDNRLMRLYDEFLTRDRCRVAKAEESGHVAKVDKGDPAVPEQKQSLVTNPEFVV